jgi:hypothetical protein
VAIVPAGAGRAVVHLRFRRLGRRLDALALKRKDRASHEQSISRADMEPPDECSLQRPSENAARGGIVAAGGRNDGRGWGENVAAGRGRCALKPC